MPLDSFPKDDESNFDLGLSQPCKVGSGENLRLLFVQAQFLTPYISMMFQMSQLLHVSTITGFHSEAFFFL